MTYLEIINTIPDFVIEKIDFFFFLIVEKHTPLLCVYLCQILSKLYYSVFVTMIFDFT